MSWSMWACLQRWRVPVPWSPTTGSMPSCVLLLFLRGGRYDDTRRKKRITEAVLFVRMFFLSSVSFFFLCHLSVPWNHYYTLAHWKLENSLKSNTVHCSPNSTSQIQSKCVSRKMGNFPSRSSGVFARCVSWARLHSSPRHYSYITLTLLDEVVSCDDWGIWWFRGLMSTYTL